MITIVILKIVAASLMGIVNALFCYLLDYCFWEGSIFGFWLPFISKRISKIKFPSDYESIMKEPIEARPGSFIELMEGKKVLLFKFLGGCIICVNVWIGMSSWLVIFNYSGLFEPWYGFVYILVGSAFLRYLTGVVYK